MAAVFEDASRTSNKSSGKAHSERASASTSLPHGGNLREGLERLTKLLTAAPIDLGGISGEIRRHPELETLILRLVVSLDLCANEPVASVEDAIVALGTGRLRVLIELWSVTGNLPQKGLPPERIAQAGAAAPSAASPEARYLANFLRCLGSDSPLHGLAGAHATLWASQSPQEHMERFTDVFMRDLFSLLPMIRSDDHGSAEVAGRKHRCR